jgi:hypothetical protein
LRKNAHSGFVEAMRGVAFRRAMETVGIDFIDENGSGPGV